MRSSSKRLEAASMPAISSPDLHHARGHRARLPQIYTYLVLVSVREQAVAVGDGRRQVVEWARPPATLFITRARTSSGCSLPQPLWLLTAIIRLVPSPSVSQAPVLPFRIALSRPWCYHPFLRFASTYPAAEAKHASSKTVQNTRTRSSPSTRSPYTPRRARRAFHSPPSTQSYLHSSRPPRRPTLTPPTQLPGGDAPRYP
ncbi:hypothetical protein C8Q77DRAFT_93092 [Trametes polyzona]|nr:hypothetical protein C8Q77DRAFT_93092 [Trametes polyzona]